jgi:tRNA pseudouridine55 synthase
MNGILNVLKPPGMTSHDVVSYIRKISGIKKVGHTGTLDPGAAGVLPICIGKATKIVDYLMNDKKTYIFELTLGNQTDTYDKYGQFIFKENKDCSKISFEDFSKVLEKFKGEICQKPPSYSAIKINGKRAYEIARKGIEIDIPLRKVFIYNIEILSYNIPSILLKIVCSKGTYIRSICNDIGTELGVGGYMSFLLRTATGNFNLKNSHTLDSITKENFSSLLLDSDAALNMRNIYISDKLSNKIMNGNSVIIKDNSFIDYNDLVKVYITPDKFVGIGKIKGNVLYIDKLLI